MRSRVRREESALEIGTALGTFLVVTVVGVGVLVLADLVVGIERSALDVLVYAVLGVATLLASLRLLLPRDG